MLLKTTLLIVGLFRWSADQIKSGHTTSIHNSLVGVYKGGSGGVTPPHFMPPAGFKICSCEEILK
jgi:hypothetical protein